MAKQKPRGTMLLMVGSSAAVGLGALLLGRSSDPDQNGSDERATADDADDAPTAAAATPSRTAGKRLTRSTLLPSGTVQQLPAVLLHEASLIVPGIKPDEFTAARLAASEHASGSDEELRAIVDAELGRAKRKQQSITQHLTSFGCYGRQGTKTLTGKTRPASTARDPYERHYRAAVDVLSGAAQGIARGATRFFDPIAQLRAWKRWRSGESTRKHCHPRVILERWSLDLPWSKASECQLDLAKPGRHPEEWIGPVAGIEPLRLMLFRPATAQHSEQLRLARRLIDALE